MSDQEREKIGGGRRCNQIHRDIFSPTTNHHCGFFFLSFFLFFSSFFLQLFVFQIIVPISLFGLVYVDPWVFFMKQIKQAHKPT